MTRELKILSWNIAHRTSAWSVLPSLGADVALLQEAVAPPVGDSVAWLLPPPRPDWKFTVRGVSPWATAIVGFDPALTYRAPDIKPVGTEVGDELAASHPGQFAVCDVSSGDTTVTLVSLYGVWERQSGVGIYSEATLHRAISDLTPLMQSRAPLLIAGDLNIFRGYSLQGQKYWQPRYDTVLDRLAAYGMELVGPFSERGTLEDCRCAVAECTHVRTYRHQNKVDSRPDQLDFVFVNKAAAAMNPVCSVVDTSETWAASDHAPVLTTLTVG